MKRLTFYQRRSKSMWNKIQALKEIKVEFPINIVSMQKEGIHFVDNFQ